VPISTGHSRCLGLVPHPTHRVISPTNDVGLVFLPTQEIFNTMTLFLLSSRVWHKR